jgi:archaeal flagellar protein FlaI
LLTKIDALFKAVETHREVYLLDITKQLNVPISSATKIVRYLEQLGLVSLDYKHIKGPIIKYLRSMELEFEKIDKDEFINKLKFFKSLQDVKAANKLIYDLYKYVKIKGDEGDKEIFKKVHDYYLNNFLRRFKNDIKETIYGLDRYKIDLGTFEVEVDIVKQELEPIPFYLIILFRVSEITLKVIEKIKEEIISKVTFNKIFKTHKEEQQVKNEYKKKLLAEMKDVFPDLQPDMLHVFSDYIVLTSLGMGDIEILMGDKNLEEIVVNNAQEPIWVYHKKHGWLQTNIIIDDESKIVHYSTLAGRNVDKIITTLTPLMDSHLKSGDRYNATLSPISSKGNTITIRKFAESPWSITDFITTKTIDLFTAALVWTAMEYELSMLIVGGTGSGKTSALNVFSIFIPPNQRIISIEDTRELRLPSTLHWVPMETRLPNPEGKGEIGMLDLIVNSLRMRPDRIIVGEIRRKREAEVLFEAMHTGHSVYATLHANTVNEAIIRLTTDPIGIPKTLLGAVDLIIVQNRNRRSGSRRTIQVAEINEKGDSNLLFSYDIRKDSMVAENKPEAFYRTLQLFSGLSRQEVDKELQYKMRILNYFVSNNITNNEQIALNINYYYVNKKFLLNKLFGDKNK